MEAYASPSWTVEAVAEDLGSWLMPIDWITLAATVLISVGTTLISDRHN